MLGEDSSVTRVSGVGKGSPQSMGSGSTRGHMGPLSVLNVKILSPPVNCLKLTCSLNARLPDSSILLYPDSNIFSDNKVMNSCIV